MNKRIFAIAVSGLALVSFSRLMSAHEQDENNARPEYQQQDDPRYDRRQYSNHGGGLNYEVDHLNRMSEHVQRELRRYGADRHISREYQHIRAETAQLNNQFRRGEQFYNRRRLRSQIEHIHNELHHIEEELHVRANDLYQWR